MGSGDCEVRLLWWEHPSYDPVPEVPMRNGSDEQLAVRKRPDWLTWLIVVVVTIIGVAIIALWWYCLLG